MTPDVPDRFDASSPVRCRMTLTSPTTPRRPRRRRPRRRRPPSPPPPTPPPPRTIWGLDPVQLHTRYWAAHGVQVVRQGEPSDIVKHAELFLLTEPDVADAVQARRR